MTKDSSVTLAAITGAHGVTGEVRLKLLGEGIEALTRQKSFDVGENGRTLTLTKLRGDSKGGAIARFAEITDRAAAEILRRSEEHTSELQSLMRISYAVFYLKK